MSKHILITGASTGIGAETARYLAEGNEIFVHYFSSRAPAEKVADEVEAKGGKVVFKSNNAGGITGGLATGQPVVVRLAVKPTPTIDIKQQTIDKYTLENKPLAAITRRDPTIVGRIWPVAENYTAMVLLDLLIAHYGYQTLMEKISA